MRSKLLLIILSIVLTANITKAGDKDIFSCDFDLIEQSLEELSSIEISIENNRIDDTDLLLLEHNFTYLSENPVNFIQPGSRFDGGAFLFGLCLGVPGVAITYLMNEEDKSALRSSVQGYLVNKVLYYGCLGVYYYILVSSAPTGTF